MQKLETGVKLRKPNSLRDALIIEYGNPLRQLQP
jgi:hypothetical protein